MTSQRPGPKGIRMGNLRVGQHLTRFLSEGLASTLKITTLNNTFKTNRKLFDLLICSSLSVAQPCLTLCDPVDCSPPGSSVHGSLQARVPERVAISSSMESPQASDRICVSCIGRQILYHLTTWEALSYLICSFYSRLCYLCKTVVLTH